MPSMKNKNNKNFFLRVWRQIPTILYPSWIFEWTNQTVQRKSLFNLEFKNGVNKYVNLFLLWANIMHAFHFALQFDRWYISSCQCVACHNYVPIRKPGSQKQWWWLGWHFEVMMSEWFCFEVDFNLFSIEIHVK